MTTFKPLKLMEKKYAINLGEDICSGDNGKIFKVDEEKIVKIPYNPFNKMLRNDRNAQFDIFNEYKNQKLALELGINYPEVEGLFAIKENKSGIYYPGLVMKYLAEGKTFDNLCGDMLMQARKQRDLEISKARDLGMLIGDNHTNNAMLHKGKVYLLDAAEIKVMSEFN